MLTSKNNPNQLYVIIEYKLTSIFRHRLTPRVNHVLSKLKLINLSVVSGYREKMQQVISEILIS